MTAHHSSTISGSYGAGRDTECTESIVSLICLESFLGKSKSSLPLCGNGLG